MAGRGGERLACTRKGDTYVRVVQDLRQRPQRLPGCRLVAGVELGGAAGEAG